MAGDNFIELTKLVDQILKTSLQNPPMNVKRRNFVYIQGTEFATLT